MGIKLLPEEVVMEKVTCDTASIVQDAHCKDCGWPVIHACANWDTEKFPTQEHINQHPDDEYYDWWGYCTNKSCINHHGRAWDQELPEFIVYGKDGGSMKNFPDNFYPNTSRVIAEIQMNKEELIALLRESIPLEKWPNFNSNPAKIYGDEVLFAGDFPEIPSGLHWDRIAAERHFSIYRDGDVLPFLNVSHVHPDSIVDWRAAR